MTTLDVLIVGAGPAGLAAATLCAECGLSTSLYDEQGGPGGQIYRGVTTSPLARPEILGDDYWHGASLVAPFMRSGARYVPRATVWSIERRDDGTFAVAIAAGPPHARHTLCVETRAVILATGAQERPFPIPGWTLPGVFMAGAVQILLKTAGIIPAGRTVLAGCGPLLWLVASQLLRAGATIDALLDTTPRGRLAQALAHAPAFLLSPYFARGRELVRAVRRRIRVVEHVTSLAVDGTGAAGPSQGASAPSGGSAAAELANEAASVGVHVRAAGPSQGASSLGGRTPQASSGGFLHAATAVRFGVGGQMHSLPIDQLLLHQGVVPDVNLAGAAGCALAWNDLQACFAPVVDAWGGTTVPGLFVAGDGAGIAGALAAEARGRLTALAVANALGRIHSDTREHAARRHRRASAKAARGRAFLDALYRPSDAFRVPEGNTLACRCEEVSAEAITQLARSGCAGPNQMKAFLRCGMGPCQGRWCGLTVTELIAHAQRRSPAEVGHYRMRFPAKPIPLGELAALPTTSEAMHAVVRTPDY